MHKLVEAGQCKGLGIANFSLPQLKAFVEYCEKNDLTVPAVHQCMILLSSDEMEKIILISIYVCRRDSSTLFPEGNS